MISIMKSKQFISPLCVTAALLSAVPASAITINFDYSYDSNNFFTAERRAVLESAASFYENFQDKLTAIDTSNSVNSWNATVTNPSDPSSIISLPNLYIPKDTVIIYLGSSSLTGNALGVASTGGYSASGTSGFFNTLRNRGQAETKGANAVDHATWGGSIYFNKDTNWNSTLNAPNSDQSDLYSVALHELGHIFGIGTADSWMNKINNGFFTGSNAVAVNGGPVAVTSDNAHFAEGIMSTVNGLPQEAALDPTIFIGKRKLLTDLEIATFKDIGWQVSEVPVPAAAWLFTSALALLVAKRKRH